METVDFFLEPGLRDSAIARQHNFIQQVCDVLEGSGLTPRFKTFDDAPSSALSFAHMKAPRTQGGLVFRRAYHYPFWQIDRSEKRHEWTLAQSRFTPGHIDGKEARQFRNFWRKRLFGNLMSREEGHIYVALQGKLLIRRSFQSCSPMRMLETVLHHSDQPVIAALHPKENYSADEIRAVESLVAKFPHGTVVTGKMDACLPGCSSVVTQTSSVAFNGYFYDKPAILFGDIDFHHIATRATPETFEAEFGKALSTRPNFAKYLWWYWQEKSINAGRKNAPGKIRARLQELGWPMKA